MRPSLGPCLCGDPLCGRCFPEASALADRANDLGEVLMAYAGELREAGADEEYVEAVERAVRERKALKSERDALWEALADARKALRLCVAWYDSIPKGGSIEFIDRCEDAIEEARSALRGSGEGR